jgi:hypothetical protein
MEPPGPRSPLSPVVSPRGERRGRFLGPILAALLLVLVVGGAAFAIDRARGDDDEGGADATRTAQTLAAADATPESTATTAATSTPTTADNAGAAPSDTQPTNTAKPTEETAAEEPSATSQPPTPTPEAQSSGTLRAADYLPTLGDLPEGFRETGEGRLRKAEVAVQLGSEEEGMELLDEWTWRENASLEFSNSGAAADETFFLSVGVHRFGRSAGASDGLNGLAEVLDSIADPNYEEVDIDEIGDEARAFAAETADANLYVLYVRSGNIVYRIGGSSLSGGATAACRRVGAAGALLLPAGRSLRAGRRGRGAVGDRPRVAGGGGRGRVEGGRGAAGSARAGGREAVAGAGAGRSAQTWDAASDRRHGELGDRAACVLPEGWISALADRAGLLLAGPRLPGRNRGERDSTAGHGLDGSDVGVRASIGLTNGRIADVEGASRFDSLHVTAGCTAAR